MKTVWLIINKKDKETMSVCKSKNIAKTFLAKHFDNSKNSYSIKCFYFIETAND